MSDELPQQKAKSQTLDERFSKRPHTYRRLQEIADQMDQAIAEGASNTAGIGDIGRATGGNAGTGARDAAAHIVGHRRIRAGGNAFCCDQTVETLSRENYYIRRHATGELRSNSLGSVSLRRPRTCCDLNPGRLFEFRQKLRVG